MFFLLSKILGYFCYPLTLLFLGLLLFVLWRRRRPRLAWGSFWVAVAWLWLCATPWGSDVLLLPLERPYLNPPPPARCDVILVLGGSLDLIVSTPQRPEYSQGADRFLYAVHLARQYPQARLLFAGGTANLVEKQKTEARLLRAEAIRLGIEPERIHCDDASRNTRENAVEARKLLDEVGGQTVVVVTSAFHMRRSRACLEKAGVRATPYAVDVRNHRGGVDPFGWVPQASRLDDATSALREYVGLVIYRLQGYI